MIRAIVAENLRRFRENMGYTQQQIANALKVDRSTYSCYELGKTSPDIDTLGVLARIFRVSISELIGENSVAAPPAVNETVFSLRKQPIYTYNLDKEEHQLICYYRSFSPEIRKKLLEMIRTEFLDG